MNYPAVPVLEAFLGGILVVIGMILGQKIHGEKKQIKQIALMLIFMAIGGVLIYIGGTGILDAAFR